jgi:hypothetical protein
MENIVRINSVHSNPILAQLDEEIASYETSKHPLEGGLEDTEPPAAQASS